MAIWFAREPNVAGRWPSSASVAAFNAFIRAVNETPACVPVSPDAAAPGEQSIGANAIYRAGPKRIHGSPAVSYLSLAPTDGPKPVLEGLKV
jgi:hypothetical protein